jgi:cytochrome c oxidase subunit 3
MENKITDKSKEEFYYEKARVKAKTNLLWFSLFSIVMFFAGLTSAFIVSRGNGFWVSLQLPKSLVVSTIIIAISSITMVLAVNAIKKNNKKLSLIFLMSTLILGILFGVFQYKGWGELYKKGYAFTGNIFNPDNNKEFFVKGEYGKDFTLFYGGNELMLENNEFYYWGTKDIKIDEQEYNDLKANMPKKAFGSKLKEVTKEEAKFINKEKNKIEYKAIVVAKNILSENQKADLAGERNVSSSYFYVLTLAHVLHVIGALIYLLFMIFKSLKGQFSDKNFLSLKLGGYFWHFLGLLWGYLFFFLYFIH